jgi:hypothetical protein
MTFPSNAYVYEFLYRGQPPGSTQAPDYHVILAVPGTDAFGNPTLAGSQAMTPDQATAEGFALPTIIAGINTALTAQIGSLQAENATLQAAQIATLQAAQIATPQAAQIATPQAAQIATPQAAQIAAAPPA